MHIERARAVGGSDLDYRVGRRGNWRSRKRDRPFRLWPIDVSEQPPRRVQESALQGRPAGKATFINYPKFTTS